MEGSQDTQPVLSPKLGTYRRGCMKAANSAHVNWGIPPIYLVEGKWADKNPWEDESVPNNAIKWGEHLKNDRLYVAIVIMTGLVLLVIAGIMACIVWIGTVKSSKLNLDNYNTIIVTDKLGISI
ncbi:hypothetical protein N7536_002986 [Penicillium majusculum]|nr:hypothetical protein N7536_002986 [Penicillium majusculum]